MWRLRPHVLRAAVWAVVAAWHARRQLRRGIARPLLPRCPDVPMSASPGVLGVLRRLDPTCLERSFVLQSWLAAHGEYRDVVIGLPKSGFGKEPAHAWVDGTDAVSPSKFVELHRLAPNGR